MKFVPVYLFLLCHKFVDTQLPLDWFSPCKSNDDCEDFKNATCTSEGYCICANDLEYGVCEDDGYVLINKVGGKCEETKNCNVNNSVCGLEKKCVCKENFVSSSDGRRCLKVANTLGDPCDETIQCATTLASSTCQNSTCVCQNSTRQHKELCLKRAALGEHCIHNEECAETAFSSCIDSKCSCTPWYVPINQRCLPVAQVIGDGCEEDVQCTSSFGDGSRCWQGSCQCRDLYQFKASNSTCVRDILLNEMCAVHSDCHQRRGGPSRLMCIEGVCKCKLEYREEDGYCTEIRTRRTKLSSSSATTRPLLFSLCNLFVVYIVVFIFQILF